MRYSSPPDPKAFAEQVYALVRRIPSGKVATYGQIALMLPPPLGVPADQYHRTGAIWVGGAMANAPDDVPWQRVINSQGKISPRPGMGPAVQRNLLEAEGVEFDAKDRVDLKRFGWREGEDGDEPEQPALL
ncbi:MAG: MGMT family protein [Anaerolineales bacterium]